MKLTATEAKNRLGHVLQQAQIQPVFIEKSGRPHSVVLSVARYEALLHAGAPDKITSAEHFSERYQGWIDEQNGRHARLGSWNDEFRRW